MAAVSVNYPTIPGLNVAPTLDDLEKSRLAYNALPDDRDQPNVTDAALADLKALLEKYDVQGRFGYHLIHGHLQVPPGCIMLGQSMAKLDACWTRPTSVDEVVLKDVHGHIFALGAEGQFTAYEYRRGPTARVSANEIAFISAIRSYLLKKNLASLIGVQLLSEDTIPKDMQEFVLSDNYGTVMMDSNMTNTNKSYRTTGWSLLHKMDGTTELKGNEDHAETVKGPHKVFIDGKGLPDTAGDAVMQGNVDEEVVIRALRREEVIN